MLRILAATCKRPKTNFTNFRGAKFAPKEEGGQALRGGGQAPRRGGSSKSMVVSKYSTFGRFL